MPSARAGSRWIRIRQLWRAASSAVLDVVYPRACVQCGRHGQWLCDACLSDVHRMTPPLCECCGREIGAGPRCQECAKHRPRIDGIRALGRFEGAVRQAVHRLKYDGQRVLAEPLAELLLPATETMPAFDAIVPVPLHPSRERQRGYNQSELLARQIGRRLELPVLAAARRVRKTEDQVKLDRPQRQANVKGAFACTTSDVAGRRLLVLDDVCTTGSTLAACAAPLLDAGAASVWGLVVARQDYERA